MAGFILVIHAFARESKKILPYALSDSASHRGTPRFHPGIAGIKWDYSGYRGMSGI